MAKARVLIKGLSTITFWGGIALTFLKFVWELVARGQEVDQFIRDLPGFIRWFDRPFAGPVVIVVGLAIYGVLTLYDSRVKAAETVTSAPAVQAQDSLLVGKFFHTFRDGDETFQFQGEVLREENGRLFVRLYDTFGYPSVQQYLTDEQTRSARFYDTPEEWREEGERLNRRAMGRHQAAAQNARWAKQNATGGEKSQMSQCFFCGPTENKITEEHVWPLWVSELLRGKYGSDHFIHVRSTGSDTTGLWKSPNLKVTTKTVCDECNNNWLSAFENDDIRPLATPLILGERVDIIKPDDQWKLAAWAYKMALLLEIAMPPEERSREFYTADERLQFHQTTVPDEHIRVFLANYQYGKHPTHAHQHLHTLTRREDGVKFHLRITTITAGCLGMQIIAIRGVDSGKLMYARTEMEFEMLGKAKVAIAPIWPPTNEAVRWSSLEVMTTEDVENWTEMWSNAENVFPVPKDPGGAASPPAAS